MKNKLFLSVDMDEIYLCRWATGSKKSIWKTPDIFFRKVYNSSKPRGDIVKDTDKILKLFDSVNFKSTFFFTGLIASFYPDLVKKISDLGHEIASHNYYHIDYEYVSKKKMYRDLKRSKDLLESITGKKVIGYRSPNSSINKDTVKILEELDFKYDSSVTPTRRLMGKFGKFLDAPLHPYNPSFDNIGKEGNSNIFEFPWAVFPLMNLPAGSGIMHRIAGNTYNEIATKFSLEKGTVAYYFHPYEISDLNFTFKKNWLISFFLRNLGSTYYNSLKNYLEKYKNRLVNGITLYEEIRK